MCQILQLPIYVQNYLDWKLHLLRPHCDPQCARPHFRARLVLLQFLAIFVSNLHLCQGKQILPFQVLFRLPDIGNDLFPFDEREINDVSKPYLGRE